MIISTLIKVVRDRLYIERDKRCLDEYNTYERKQNGAYGAITGKHDDLLMTRAIGLHICFREMDMPEWVPIVNRTLRKTEAPFPRLPSDSFIKTLVTSAVPVVWQMRLRFAEPAAQVPEKCRPAPCLVPAVPFVT